MRSQFLLSQIVLFFFICLPGRICAQIPNGNFEIWPTGLGDPPGWHTNNVYDPFEFIIIGPGEPYAGNFGITGEVDSSTQLGCIIAPEIISENIELNYRPEALHGYFKFFPKGEIITEGIPFDTPDAGLRRGRNQSTFESIANKYAITDNAIIKMGKIIYDIEVNVWGKKIYQKSRKIKEDIREIIDTSKNDEDILKKSESYFDNLYKTLLNQEKHHSLFRQ